MGLSLILTNQHDRDFLSWRQQLETKAISHGDESMITVGVESMTVLTKTHVVINLPPRLPPLYSYLQNSLID